ncbi:MAG: hypothetical protein ACK4TC_08240 [Sphingomonas pseudosanguinis]|uniref:hypothetical protein n=1 Tax=Sphingomonas pseudosanguinis TaxID=413712 RepID=UPI003918BC73
MFDLLALAAAALTPCPVERAHYILRDHPDVTADFRSVARDPDWPSGLALGVHHTASGRTFWWLPWNGGSDGLQNVASTGDVTAKGWHPPDPDGGPRPFGDRHYIGTDAAYHILNRVPNRGEPAPAHMLFPDSAGSQDHVFVARQFFDLAGCRPKSG